MRKFCCFGIIYREKSAVSHCTYRHPLVVKQVKVQGATAFSVSGLFKISV